MTDGLGGAILGLAGGAGESGAAPALRARGAGDEAADPQAFRRVLADQTTDATPAEPSAVPPAVPAPDGPRSAATTTDRQPAGGSPLPRGRPEAAAAATVPAGAATAAAGGRVALATPGAGAGGGEAAALARTSIRGSPDAIAEAVRGQVGPQIDPSPLLSPDMSSRPVTAARGESAGALPVTPQGLATDGPGRPAAGAVPPARARAGDAAGALPGMSGSAANTRGPAAPVVAPGENGTPARIPTAPAPERGIVEGTASRPPEGALAATVGDPSRFGGSRSGTAARATEAGAEFRAIATGDAIDGRTAAGTATTRVADVLSTVTNVEARPPGPADAGVSPTPLAAAGPPVSAASSSVAPSPMPATTAEGQYSLQAQPGDPAFEEELGVRMQVMLREGVREARLQLHPAELGRIQVTISTDGDQARVLFVADTAGAREAIEQSMPRLRDMLEQQGLQLAHSDTQERGAEGGSGGARDDVSMAFAEHAETADDFADPAARPRSPTGPAGGVDIYA